MNFYDIIDGVKASWSQFATDWQNGARSIGNSVKSWNGGDPSSPFWATGKIADTTSKIDTTLRNFSEGKTTADISSDDFSNQMSNLEIQDEKVRSLMADYFKNEEGKTVDGYNNIYDKKEHGTASNLLRWAAQSYVWLSYGLSDAGNDMYDNGINANNSLKLANNALGTAFVPVTAALGGIGNTQTWWEVLDSTVGAATRKIGEWIQYTGLDKTLGLTQEWVQDASNLALAWLTYGAAKGVTKWAKIAAPKISSAIDSAGTVIAPALEKGKNIMSDFGAKVKNPELASKLSSSFNRIDPTKYVEFKKMTGENVGQFLVNRGIKTVGDDTVMKTSDLFRKSIEEADKGFAAIEGRYTYGGGVDPIKMAIDEIRSSAQASADNWSWSKWKLESIARDYENGGITNVQLNSLKRMFQDGNKFSYMKEQLSPESVQKATNILNEIRSFQFELAKQSGFDNIAQINKNTQAYKFISDALQKKLEKQSGNNNVSLTDWILMAGWTPETIGMAIGKRLVSSDKAKTLILKATSWRKVKNELDKADTNSIIKENIKRQYGMTSDRSSTLSDRVNSPLVWLKALPAPSGKGNILSTKKTNIVYPEKASIIPPKKTVDKLGKNELHPSIFANKWGFIDPSFISRIVKNSFENTSLSDAKPGRLSWEKLSYEEARTEITKKWTPSKARIVVWLDDNGALILRDGRHLLQAYKDLKKEIPSSVILFESKSAEKKYLSHSK